MQLFSFTLHLPVDILTTSHGISDGFGFLYNVMTPTHISAINSASISCLSSCLSTFLKKSIYLFCISSCVHVCYMPEEGTRTHYKWLQVTMCLLGIGTQDLWPVPLITEPSLQPPSKTNFCPAVDSIDNSNEHL